MSTLKGTAFFAYASVPPVSSATSAMSGPGAAREADPGAIPYPSAPAPIEGVTPSTSNSAAPQPQIQPAPSGGASTSRRRASSHACPSRSCSPTSSYSPRRASKMPRVAVDAWGARVGPIPDPGKTANTGGDAMHVDSPQATASSHASTSTSAWLGPEAGTISPTCAHAVPATTACTTATSITAATSSAPHTAPSQSASNPTSGSANAVAGTGSHAPNPSQPRPHPHPPSGPSHAPDGGGANERRVMPPTLAEAALEDVLVMVADMLTRLLEHNDSLPAPPGDKKWGASGGLTRFHSRVVPGITVQDYLVRMARYTSLEKVCVLLVLVYIDRIAAAQSSTAPEASAGSGSGASSNSGTGSGAGAAGPTDAVGADSEEGDAFSYLPNSEPRFTLCSLTVHRFVCAAIVCSSKALCDSFATNAHYAKVGGISLQELNVLERELLRLIRWRLVCSSELLEQYYRSLVAAHPDYVLAETFTPSEPQPLPYSHNRHPTNGPTP